MSLSCDCIRWRMSALVSGTVSPLLYMYVCVCQSGPVATSAWMAYIQTQGLYACQTFINDISHKWDNQKNKCEIGLAQAKVWLFSLTYCAKAWQRKSLRLPYLSCEPFCAVKALLSSEELLLGSLFSFSFGGPLLISKFNPRKRWSRVCPWHDFHYKMFARILIRFPAFLLFSILCHIMNASINA